MRLWGEEQLLSAGNDFFFYLRHTARLKLQFHSGTGNAPFEKSGSTPVRDLPDMYAQLPEGRRHTYQAKPEY